MKHINQFSLIRITVIALWASVLMSACTPESNRTPADRQQSPIAADTLEFSVQMNEFAFTPDTLRLPAGQPIRLTFLNAGTVLHEFMAGRSLNSESNGFLEGLFADMELHMDRESMNSYGRTGEEHNMNSPDPTGHMTMLLLDPGTTSTMTFTLPSSRSGTWMMSCFQTGHFQSGMKGTIIVA